MTSRCQQFLVSNFVPSFHSSKAQFGWPSTSDVKPKLKIPIGTAVFAQNFPG